MNIKTKKAVVVTAVVLVALLALALGQPLGTLLKIIHHLIVGLHQHSQLIIHIVIYMLRFSRNIHQTHLAAYLGYRLGDRVGNHSSGKNRGEHEQYVNIYDTRYHRDKVSP